MQATPHALLDRLRMAQGRFLAPALALAAGLLITLAHEYLLPPPAATAFRTWIRPLLWTLGTLCFWIRGRQPGEAATGWRLIGASMGLRALGQVVHAFHAGTSLRLFFSVAATLLLLLGLLRWFERELLRGDGLRRFLEGGIVALALLTLAWGFLLAPSGVSSRMPWQAVFLSASLYALLLGIVIAHALVNPRRLLGPLGWIHLYLLAELAMQVYAFRTGPPPESLNQLLTRTPPSLVLLMVLAAATPWARERTTPWGPGSQNLWNVLLVYVPAGLATLTVLLSIRPESPLNPGLAALLCLMSLGLLLRQVLALLDLGSSFHILQTQLDLRTRSLEEHQAALERNHRMNLLSTLGAGLAHDFNNLLTVILQEIERGRTQDALASVHRASALVRQLLRLAREEQGHPELFELGELLRSRMRILQKVCPREIHVSLHLEPGECWLEADPLQIEQVMLNLVTNARDAIDGPGFIRVRLRRLPDGQALLEVEDSGPGMDADVQARLFEPFFTTKAPGHGTGLGLASVEAILQKLEGTVDVVTAPGLGTTFRLRLPTVDVD